MGFFNGDSFLWLSFPGKPDPLLRGERQVTQDLAGSRAPSFPGCGAPRKVRRHWAACPEAREHGGVDAVGLGHALSGPGESACMSRIHFDQRQASCAQHALEQPMVNARRLLDEALGASGASQPISLSG